MNLRETLELDAAAAVAEIVAALRKAARRFRRRGAVLGLSGGIDSSVTAALAAKAFGPERVLGLLMPEDDSAEREESLELGGLLARHLGMETVTEDITPLLEASGCYERRDEAFARTIPGYGPGWRSKIVLPSLLESDSYRISRLVAVNPEGERFEERMTPDAYLQAVAATNFKQRTRKMLEYYHADRLNRLVTGTPNRLEFDQGFFVKLGDGAADIKPIAHLYKTQVYQLAEHLGLPEEISSRPPTTDTYSLPQSQEEFYFSVPHSVMDLCLLAVNEGVSAAEAAPQAGLSVEQTERVFADIEAKRRVSEYLHSEPLLVS
ncbi:MAG TPA: NAD(+) synthase [Deinococcales bacterium]|nr:NAD(+) synthase [Deinococcales bacterium]